MKKMFLAAVAVSAVAAFADEVCEENATKQDTNPMTEEVKDYVCVDGVWVEKGSKCAPGQHQTYTAPDGKTTNYVCNNEGSAWVEVAEGESTSSETVAEGSSSSETVTEGESSSSVTSSETVTEESSSSVKANDGVIADFEDGKNVAAILSNADSSAYWSAYTYSGATMTTTDANAIANGSIHIEGVNLGNPGENDYPGAGFGVNFKDGPLSGCTELSYKYKGSQHKFTMGQTDITVSGQEFTAIVDASSDWTTKTIKLDNSFTQPDWISTKVALDLSKANAIKWAIDKDVTNGGSLYVDDITCVGMSGEFNTGSTTDPSSSGSGDVSGWTDIGMNEDKTNATGEYWYVYTDVNDKGASTISNPEPDEYGYTAIFTDDGIYAGVNGISLNKGGNANDPYVAIGTDLGKAVNCSAFSYEYKGATHNFKTPLSTVEDYADYYKVVSKANDWTQVIINTSELAQPSDWGAKVPFDATKITKFSWEVKATADDSKLYVRNFKCNGSISTSPVDKSSSNPTNNNSSTNKSTSPNNNTNPYAAIMGSAAQVGLKASVHGTTLDISVAKAGLVKVNVFDMMGHAIETHVENMTAGTYGHSLANLSKGAYIVRVQQGSEQKVIRTQVR